MSKLHDAIREMMFGGSAEVEQKIRDLVKKKPGLLEEPDKTGLTPLFLACSTMRTAIVKLMVDLGADVNAKNAQGWPVFFNAASSVGREALELMIQKGADPKVSVNGETALHRAMLNESTAVANATLLLEHGVDINSRDQMGWNAVDKAALDNLVDATKFLISKGAEVNHRDQRGMTAQEVAKERGYTEVVELLTQAEAKK